MRCSTQDPTHRALVTALMTLVTGTSEVLACSGGDSSASISDARTPPQVDNPVFEIGYNDQGFTSKEHFYATADGAAAPVVRGSQGAWMFVVAVRTNRLPNVDRVTVEASLGPPGGAAYGTLKYKKRPLFDGGDGFGYLMNVWLVVSNDESWDGQTAQYHVRIETEDGGVFMDDTVRLTLHKEAP